MIKHWFLRPVFFVSKCLDNRTFSLGLAVIDTIFIMTLILNYGLPALFQQNGNMHPYPSYWSVIFPVSSSAYIGKVYLIVLLTLERYTAVCYPQKSSSLFSLARIKIYIGIISLFAVMYSLPRFFELKWEENKGNISEANPSKLCRRNQDSFYYRFYVIWLTFGIQFFLPLLCLTTIIRFF